MTDHQIPAVYSTPAPIAAEIVRQKPNRVAPIVAIAAVSFGALVLFIIAAGTGSRFKTHAENWNSRIAAESRVTMVSGENAYESAYLYEEDGIHFHYCRTTSGDVWLAAATPSATVVEFMPAATVAAEVEGWGVLIEAARK